MQKLTKSPLPHLLPLIPPSNARTCTKFSHDTDARSVGGPSPSPSSSSSLPTTSTSRNSFFSFTLLPFLFTNLPKGRLLLFPLLFLLLLRSHMFYLCAFAFACAENETKCRRFFLTSHFEGFAQSSRHDSFLGGKRRAQQPSTPKSILSLLHQQQQQQQLLLLQHQQQQSRKRVRAAPVFVPLAFIIQTTEKNVNTTIRFRLF